jgi:hypothetical protein
MCRYVYDPTSYQALNAQLQSLIPSADLHSIDTEQSVEYFSNTIPHFRV